MSELNLVPGETTLDQLAGVYWNQSPVVLDRSCKAAVERAASRVTAAAMGNQPVYGVNTGFGKLASLKIDPGDTAQL